MKPRIIVENGLKLTVGCCNEVSKGAYTFICGTKSKAGNYQYCHICGTNKKILDADRSKRDASLVDREDMEDES